MTNYGRRSIPNRPIPRRPSLQSLTGPTSLAPGQPGKGGIRLLRLAQVINLTGLGKTKIYELQSEGAFPMRVRITEHTVGWVEDEVQAWLASRVETRAIPTTIPGSATLRPPSR